LKQSILVFLAKKKHVFQLIVFVRGFKLSYFC